MQATDLPITARQIINIYCADITEWSRYSAKTINTEFHAYTVADFTEAEVLHSSDTLMHLRIYDGDDGGPTELIATQVTRDDDLHLTSVTQVFDTLPRLVWTEEEGFVSLPNNDYRENTRNTHNI